jgi:hypothetical protein
MSLILSFLADKSGRWFRIIAGALFVVVTGWLTRGWPRIVFVFIGFIPVAAGMADVVLVSLLFRMPISGRKIRKIYAEPGDGDKFPKDSGRNSTQESGI